MSDTNEPTGKAKDPKKAVAKFITYLAPHKASIIIAVFFAMVSTVFSVIGPRLLGRVTDVLLDGIMAHWLGTGLLTNFPYIITIVALLIVLYIVSAACSLAQESIMARLSIRVTYKLRTEISEKMHRMPINYYDTHPIGEVLSRITNDIDIISQMLTRNLTQLITAATSIIGILAMMIWVSPLMTLVVLLVFPIVLMFMGPIMKKSQAYFAKQQETIGIVSGIVEETYGGHNVVRAYNAEANVEEKFDKANNELYGSAWKAQFMSGVVEPLFGFIGNLGFVLSCIMGGFLVVQRVITIGDVQAFIQYIQNFMMPLSDISVSGNQLQMAIAAGERVFEFLDEDEETPDVMVPVNTEISLPWKRYEGNVSFQNVRFGYNPDKIILNNFSAEISAGQTVAIVGPTGAGKTTVIKLLMRFYELNGGKILIDGIDATDFTRGDLRNIFGTVLQDTWLYNASIMENIRYGSPDATDEQVVAAAKAAHCHGFIRALPGGYGMILNEEASNISQGQKQLFTIARVILKNPAILILDEATSSIDTRTEILIQRAMKNIMKGRTSFVIAHRLSTIRDADLIFVMNEGDIIEQGNHGQLLEANGFYADLYNSQFSEGEPCGIAESRCNHAY